MNIGQSWLLHSFENINRPINHIFQQKEARRLGQAMGVSNTMLDNVVLKACERHPQVFLEDWQTVKVVVLHIESPGIHMLIQIRLELIQDMICKFILGVCYSRMGGR